MSHIVGNLSTRGYNFDLDLISLGGLHTKLWASKVVGVSTLGILGLPLGSPRIKWHLGARPVARHIEYYKGKVVASPKFGPWWVLWVHVCPWFVCAPKCSNYALTKLLFSLCKSVWVINLLLNLLSPHPKAPTHPSTLEVLWTRERTLTPFLFIVFIFGLALESIKELTGASIWLSNS